MPHKLPTIHGVRERRKITSFFQSSPKDAPLPIRWTAHRHSVAIVRVVPLASKSQDFATGRVPDPLVYMVTTYAALDPMYVDVVSCSSGHLGSCDTYRIYIYTLYLRTYRPTYTCDRDHTYASARSCNCVTHNYCVTHN